MLCHQPSHVLRATNLVLAVIGMRHRIPNTAASKPHTTLSVGASLL